MSAHSGACEEDASATLRGGQSGDLESGGRLGVEQSCDSSRADFVCFSTLGET